MNIHDHVDRLEIEAELLAAAAQRSSWQTPVPGLSWTLRELVTHLGGVHRWAAGVVRDAAPSSDTPAARAVGTGPQDADLLAWFRQGCAELVATLRAAPADLSCAAFLPAPSPLAFWARRQAHETAVHRADAEAAAGAVTPFPATFAQDGIAELLQGFAARRSMAVPRAGVLVLRASDGPSWRVELGGERTTAAPVEDADGDAVVSGTSSRLYLWLWNRPAEVVVTGDPEVAGAWSQHVRVRWG